MATELEKYAYMSPEQLSAERVIGYVGTREDSSAWIFLGVNPSEVGKAIADEVSGDEGLSLEERSSLTIKPQIFTLAEISDMPEFPGW